MHQCRICDNAAGNRLFEVREMMFNLRKLFPYFECAECGCLQIAEIPDDLSPYYPATYYSLARLQETGTLKKYLRRCRFRHSTGVNNLVGRIVTKYTGSPVAANWIQKTGIKPAGSILDVGCGAGQILLELSDYGFTDLTGIDKFIAEDIRYQSGIKIYKREMAEMDCTYDLVMLHHSFEHMTDPLVSLKQVRRLMKSEGIALIRIPLTQKYAWHKYGVNWVQLDAPRHLHLHTEKSIRLLTDKAGLQVSEVVYDSTAIQFWGSEQYVKGIHMLDERSHWGTGRGEIFSEAELKTFALKALELNEKKDGDQACFFLRHNGKEIDG